MPYLPKESSNPKVDRTMQRREDMIRLLKFHLIRAHNRMKMQANRHRSERQLEFGAWVWLKQHPYRKQSLRGYPNEKLSPRFHGPFQIEAKIGVVAYKLKLPTHVQFHPVFHMSQLKPFRGHLPVVLHIPDWHQGQDIDTPIPSAAILDKRVLKASKFSLKQYLIQLQGLNTDNATWENAIDFEKRFPHFDYINN